jgi:thiol-disulfide isomerase/thioredoxin
MLRLFCPLAVLCAAVALCASGPARVRAADPAPGVAGNWKLTVPVDRGEEVVMLIGFAEKEGKWTAEYLGANEELKVKPTVTSVKVTGDGVQFTLGFMGRELVSFDGVLSKDKKKLNGSLAVLGGRIRPTSMYPTKLAKLSDPFEVAKEALAQIEDGAELFDVAFAVLGQAGAKKLPADEARGIVERVTKSAGTFGPRWERDTTLRLVEVLSAQEGLGELAIAQAKRAERLLTDDDTTATRMMVLEALIRTLTKAGKADEAKPHVAALAKLELRDFAEYAKTNPPFKAEPFAGRKGKSDRAAVVEVFTGAECPPCVGVDLAFDGLLKAYKPADVILLQYHFHVPRPDPLTSPDAMERVKYYEDKIEGAPTLFISGKLGTDSGGPAAASEKFYKTFRSAIDDLLEKPAGAKLALTVGKGEKGGLTAKASVTDLDAPGDKVMLRFVLVEERVRYTGGNGIRYHHMVVRSMPGGAKGTPLTKKTHEQSVTIDTDALRADLTKYLDNFAKTEGQFPRADRPLALRNLKLVALVQNDATKEIVQAVQVDLP